MNLLDGIIQVFDLTNLYGLTRFLLESLKGGGVSTALVDGNFGWKAMLANRFLEKNAGQLSCLGGQSVGSRWSGLPYQRHDTSTSAAT